jgi:hypothetical protein
VTWESLSASFADTSAFLQVFGIDVDRAPSEEQLKARKQAVQTLSQLVRLFRMTLEQDIVCTSMTY